MSDLSADPLEQFCSWLRDAKSSDAIAEPDAMVVATVDPDGGPSARMVLLRGIDHGFVFFTNRTSRKGRALAHDDRCTLVFPWHPIHRQVIVDGRADPISELESDEYFAGRPHGSQLGAWASSQSSVLAGGRSELDGLFAAAASRWADQPVPRPPHWGGYRVIPCSIEFWQGQPSRLHDRLRFRRADQEKPGDGWVMERLAP